MRIAIIGDGNVGGTLGKGWAKKGHDVFFGVRNPTDDKTRQLVQAIGSKAQAGTVGEAAAFGQVVVLATPWNAAEAAIREAPRASSSSRFPPPMTRMSGVVPSPFAPSCFTL